MSSILKALKKLEHEKATQKPDSFRIDAEILRGETPSRRLISSGASLAAVALFLCGVAATYLFMKHEETSAPDRTSRSSKNELYNGNPSPGATSPVSIKPSAEPQSRLPAAVIPVPEARVNSPRTAESQPQIQRVNPAGIAPQPTPPEARPVPHTPLPLTTAPVAAAAYPVLKLHGIAFQDGAESAAVVNGVTVSNGSVIEGASVVEIQKDRVRFSRGGETFDIILDKAN